MQSTRRRNRPYGLLAEHYEAVIPGVSEMNRVAREAMLGPIFANAASVCDLACGGGELARAGARAGKRAFAVDLSPGFCARVRARARSEQLEVGVVRADMRTFRLPERVDLVVCEFAALNNLDDRSGLPAVFRAVRRALKPGGHFLFDVNTPLSFKTQCNATHWYDTRAFKLVLRGSLEDQDRRARLDLEWFLPRGRSFVLRRETIYNVCWTDREIRAALRRAGIDLVRVCDGVDVRPTFPGAVRGTDMYYLTRALA
jgi:SAM-dependent methyltransferase